VRKIAGKPKKVTKRKQNRRAKLDEIMKYLFSVSKGALVKMLNSLFRENYDPDMVDIVHTNSEFEDFNLKILRGDMFFRITDRKDGKPFHYHLEYQSATRSRRQAVVQRYLTQS
jgi:hypothetical protein